MLGLDAEGVRHHLGEFGLVIGQCTGIAHREGVKPELLSRRYELGVREDGDAARIHTAAQLDANPVGAQPIGNRCGE